MVDRPWNSPAARALALVAGVRNPATAMQLFVDELLLEADQRVAPVHLPLVASFRGVVAIEHEPGLRASALLSPGPDGYRILLNPRDPEVRQNFSVCHEICHTFFPSFGHIAAVPDIHIGGSTAADDEERLCDQGASRVLLPPHLLRPVVEAHTPSIDALVSIAGAFGASLEATAIALSQLNIWRRAVLVLEERDRVRRAAGAADPPALRVHMVCVPAAIRGHFFIPRNKSVSPTGPIHAAMLQQSRTAGIEVLDLPSGALRLETESVPAPFTRDGVTQHRVVSLVRPV